MRHPSGATPPPIPPTPAERRVRRAFPHGAEIDLRALDEDERTVRAEVLRALLLRGSAAREAAEPDESGEHEPAERGEEPPGIPALRLTGARITGALDLGSADIDVPVRLRGCHFDRPPDLHAARTRQINLTGSTLPGLTASGVRMDGALHLTGCRSTGPIRLTGARIAGALLAEGARLRSARTAEAAEEGEEGGEEPVLRLDAARIENDLWAPRLSAAGSVSLTGARIDGALNLRDARLAHSGGVCLDAGNMSVGSGVVGMRLSARGEVRVTGARVTSTFNLEHATLHNPGGTALAAAVTAVGLDMLCVGIRADGEVRFSGASVTGRLNVTDAVLDNPGGKALRADHLTVGAEIPAWRLTARGCVDLRAAAVAGRIDLAHARLRHEEGALALRVADCSAAELSLREAQPIGGPVNLRNARFDLLYATPEVWPATVMLDGLAFGALVPHLPARARLPALERDADGHVPRAYEQLAAAYGGVGDDASARDVRLAAQRRRRSGLPWYARAWGHLQDATVGYGYRPLRATFWLAVLLAAGGAAFAVHPPPPLDAGKAPDFNPFVYALDLLLPVVDFGQAGAFAPRGALQWLSYVLVAAGWVLAGTAAAGVSRTLGRTR